MDIPGVGLNTDQLMRMYVAYQLVSALQASLPVPQEGGNLAYAIFYKFFSLLTADFKGFISKPQSPAPPNPTPPPADPEQLH